MVFSCCGYNHLCPCSWSYKSLYVLVLVLIQTRVGCEVGTAVIGKVQLSSMEPDSTAVTGKNKQQFRAENEPMLNSD